MDQKINPDFGDEIKMSEISDELALPADEWIERMLA